MLMRFSRFARLFSTTTPSTITNKLFPTIETILPPKTQALVNDLSETDIECVKDIEKFTKTSEYLLIKSPISSFIHDLSEILESVNQNKEERLEAPAELSELILNFASKQEDGTTLVLMTQETNFAIRHSIFPAIGIFGGLAGLINEIFYGTISYLPISLYGITVIGSLLYIMPSLFLGQQRQITQIRLHEDMNRLFIKCCDRKSSATEEIIISRDAFQFNYFDNETKKFSSFLRDGMWCLVDGEKMWLPTKSMSVNNHLYNLIV